MRVLLHLAITFTLSLSVSGTFLTGDKHDHRLPVVGAEGWKALVASSLALTPHEARVGKRVDGTTTGTTTPPSSTSTATTTADTSATTTATTPIPWVSLDAEGSPVTVTPIVTTDALGSPSTAFLAPTSTSLTDTDKTDNNDNTNLVDIHCTTNQYQDGGKYAPFCLPHNGSTWRVDEKGASGFYYVTWNPSVFTSNETVYMSLNFVNHSLSNDPSAAGIWVKSIGASLGWVTIHPESHWLDDSPNGDSVDVFFLLQGTRSNTLYTGPTISITTKPKPPKVDTSPNNRPPVNRLGLAIGLPVVLVFVAVMVLGTHFCLRERRKVGPIHIGGVRGRKEYGTRMSRRQRMKGAGVPLAQGEEYHDEREGEERDGKIGDRGNHGGDWELSDVRGGREREYDDDDTREVEGRRGI